MARYSLKKRMTLMMMHLPKKMRYFLMRKMLNLPEFPDNLSLEIAKTRADLDAAFSILYDSYLKEGITAPDPSGRRITIYHALPTTTTLVAKQKGSVVATISIVRDGKFGVPADDLIDLSAFRVPGKRIAELSSFAMRSDLQGRASDILFYLTKYAIRYSREYFGVDRFVIAIHPKRVPVYEGIFLLDVLNKKVIESYRFANNAPAVNATICLETIEERYEKIYNKKPDKENLFQFLFRSFSEKEKEQTELPERRYATIIDPVLTPDLMDYFFKKQTSVLKKMTDRQLQKLGATYPYPEYQKLFPRKIEADKNNKRNGVRYEMKCYGLVYPENKSMPAFINILDVSEAGMQVQAETRLDTDTPLTFFVVIGKQNVSTVKGLVKWSKDQVSGVEFAQKDTKWSKFVAYQYERILTASPEFEPYQIAAS